MAIELQILHNKRCKLNPKETEDLKTIGSFNATGKFLKTVDDNGRYLSYETLFKQYKDAIDELPKLKEVLSKDDFQKLVSKIEKQRNKFINQRTRTSKYMSDLEKKQLASEIESKVSYLGLTNGSLNPKKKYQIMKADKDPNYCRSSNFFKNSMICFSEKTTHVENKKQYEYSFVRRDSESDSQCVYASLEVSKTSKDTAISFSSDQLGDFSMSLSHHQEKNKFVILFNETFPKKVENGPFPEEIQLFMIKKLFELFPDLESSLLESDKIKLLRSQIANRLTFYSVIDSLRSNCNSVSFSPNGGNSQNFMNQLKKSYGELLQRFHFSGETTMECFLSYDLSLKQVYRKNQKRTDSSKLDDFKQVLEKRNQYLESSQRLKENLDINKRSSKINLINRMKQLKRKRNDINDSQGPLVAVQEEVPESHPVNL